MARLTMRLSGTEKQRDDALEALVLQQEIAEDLERERKRNQKDLVKIQHKMDAMARQRDEAQRVVLHLRSLIHGQSHHMEHMLRSIGSSTEISDFLGFDETTEDAEENGGEEEGADGESVRAASAAGGQDSSSSMNPDLEDHLLGLGKAQKRLARLSITDVADRYLRDKTDAIADIIRNISEQCAAAVEGLQLAQDAEEDEPGHVVSVKGSAKNLTLDYATRDELSEGEGNLLHPEHCNSSIPPTPELVHNRSSTSMSMVSNSTYQERASLQYGPGEIPTRIVEDDDEPAQDAEGLDDESETGTLTKQASDDIIRPPSARIMG